MHKRASFLGVGGLVATLGVAPSWAESAAAEAPREDSVSLQEVVVTAQKRGENLQSTPVTVSALQADTLQQQGVVNAQDLQGLVPGLEVSQNSTYTDFAIRGIFSTNDTALGDPAVAFHLDGVFLGRPNAAGGALYDLERIEVLRGPQGTIYGRNATAGAINVITRKPSMNTYLETSVQGGNYSAWQVGGVFNTPVTSDSAVRLAAQSVNHAGFANNGYEDQKEDSARLQYLWTPSEAVSLLLGADYDHRGGRGVISYPVGRPGGPRDDGAPANGTLSSDVKGVHAQLDADVGIGTLTVLPAYYIFDFTNNTYSLGSAGGWNPFLLHSKDDQSSIEMRLSSHAGDRIKWVAGLYWLHENQDSYLTVVNGVGAGLDLAFPYPTIGAKSRAAFGQVTLPFGDAWNLTAGLRYTRDRKYDDGSTDIIAGPNVVTSIPNVADHEWSAFNYRVGIDRQITAKSMAYANVATGYKAGGNYDGLPPNSYDPEKLLAYELGIKSRFLDNRAQLNADTFYYQYKNYQATELDCVNSPPGSPPCSAIGAKTFNAARATVFGVEAESSWLFTADDRLDVTVAYIRGKFTSFVLPPTPFAAGGDFSGDPLPKSPKWTATLGYSHSWRFDGGHRLVLAAQTHLASSQNLQFNPTDPNVRQGGYMTSNASFSWESGDGHWSAGVFGRNLQDRLVKSNFALSTGGPTVSYLPPRTYGVRLTYRY